MEVYERNTSHLKVQLKFSDIPTINIEDFLNLFRSLYQINNVSYLIYNGNEVEANDIKTYSIETVKHVIGEENSLRISKTQSNHHSLLKSYLVL